MLEARFRRFYGAAWRDATYPTADSVIPVDDFWRLYHAMPPVAALERIQLMEGTSLAIALAFAKDGKRPESVTQAMREAYLEG